MKAPLHQRIVGEALGTFFLVLFGPGAVMVDAWTGGKVTVLGIALAFAFVITAVVAVLGRLSGAHINPAVSIAQAWRGALPIGDLAPYVIAQLLGAVAGSSLMVMALGRVGHVGATLPSVGLGASFLLEFVMSVALGFAAFRARGPSAPLWVGLTVGVCALVGGPLTGASMNPARSFGPALVGGEWAGHWIYWLAPIMGIWTAARLSGKIEAVPATEGTADA